MTDLRKGYDPSFLYGASFSKDSVLDNILKADVTIALPEAGPEIRGDILFVEDGHTKQYVFNYVHYSLIMSKFNKQAFVSAANYDQSDNIIVSGKKGRKWFIDSRIGADNQVGPAAYKHNAWDRGHLTKRTAITWGETYHEAERASNDSCSYANASMQHENFNQDEWRVPEEIVRHFKKDLNNRITIFTGPVFTHTDRWYTRRQDQMVRIPSGFWKMVVYIDKANKQLETQAYVMYQDDDFVKDKKNKIQIKNYQATTTEIEQLTGLEFDQKLYDTNPLYFYKKGGRSNKGPERYSIPSSTKDLKSGVVFERKTANSAKFQARLYDIDEGEFVKFVDRIRDR